MRLIARVAALCLFLSISSISFSQGGQSRGSGGDDDNGPETECVSPPFHPDFDALKRFFGSTGGLGWNSKVDWLSCNVCLWEGITCEGNRVTEIDLPNNGIGGYFQFQPGDLSELRVLKLAGNQVNLGFTNPTTIPPFLNHIDLSDNNLSQWPLHYSLPFLRHLDMSGNQFALELSSTIFNNSNLEFLDLSNNYFYGNFPTSFGQLASLGYLDLSDNALSGCIPSSYNNHCDIRNNVFLDNNCNLGMPAFADWCSGASCSVGLELGAPSESCVGEVFTLAASAGYDTYTWEGPCDVTENVGKSQIDYRTFSAACPGTYSVTVTTSRGCELTASITVDTYVEPDRDTSVVFCEDSSVTVGDEVFTFPETRRVPQTTPEGCSYDLIVTATEIPRPRRTVFLEVCDGEMGYVHSTPYSSAGTFPQTQNNPSGCDSLLTVNVTILPNFTSTVNYAVCPGQQATHDGIQYNVGNWDRTYTAANGCDSIVYINVSELDTYVTEVDLSTCSGTTVMHDGIPYGPGPDSRMYIAANGCDSLINIYVTELFPSNDSETRSICNGQSVNVMGNDYTGGNYAINFTNSDGCASILNLTVNETPPYEISEQALICDGEPLEYDAENTFYNAGTYEVAKVDNQGCNYTVNLTVDEGVDTRSEVFLIRCDGENPIIYEEEVIYNHYGVIHRTNASGCDSLVLIWVSNVSSTSGHIYPDPVCWPERVEVNGEEYSYTNTFEQILTNAAGCDSTLYVHVEVNREKKRTIFRDICPGGTVTVNDETYSFPATYTQFLTTAEGCDSILTIRVEESDIIIGENTVIICGVDTYTENGTVYSETGTYDLPFTTAESCDSIYRLHIEKYENTARTIYDRLCTGDRVEYNDEEFSTGGTYVQNLENANGCDSTLTIIVEEFSPTSSYVVRETCEGQPWRENGQNFITPGLHEQVIPNSVNCDSTITIDLIVHEHTEETLNIQLCTDQSETINGIVYNSTTTDVQNLDNAAGCDSTLNIFVTVVDAVREEMFLNLCEGDFEEVNGYTFDKTETRDQFFTAVSGCDSILTVRATFYEHTFGEAEITVCTGNETILNGISYTAGGIQTQKILNSNGCDSTITVYIEELSPSSSQNVFTMCEGDGTTINGIRYEFGGNFQQKYENAVGCDSIFYIELIEFPDTESNEIHFICPGEQVSVNDRTYSVPGMYDQPFTNARGCDSTLIVEVRYSDPKDTTLYDFICDEGTYPWKGDILTSPGYYSFDTLTTRGCDSIVFLNLGYLTGNDTTIYRTICEGDYYEFGTRNISTEGSYFDNIIIGGCKSPTTLELTVLKPVEGFRERHICEGDQIWIDGKWVLEGGIYPEIRKSKAGCDSILYTEVIIEYPASSRIDTFMCAGESIFIGGLWFHEPGFWQLAKKTKYLCDSTVNLQINLYDTLPDVFDYEVCEGEEITFLGNSYRAGVHEGTYNDGTCDQGYILNVLETNIKKVNKTLIICDEPISYLGETYESSGHYLMQQDLGGCEFLEYLNILKAEQDGARSKVFLCPGSTMELGTSTIESGGMYTDTICGAPMEIEVIYISGDSIHMEESIFPGESVVIEGEVFNAAGEYMINVGSEAGCESTLTLTLKIEACGGERTITHSMCRGETYDFYGTAITEGGTHEHLKNLGNPGCDSLLLLDISFTEVLPFHIQGPLIFCENETAKLSGPEGYTYHWSTGQSGQEIEVTKSGLYSLSIQDENGCMETAEIEIEKIKFPSSLDIEIRSPKSCDMGDGEIHVIAEDSEDYLFSIDNGLTWQESPEFNGLEAGEYMVVLGDPTLTCIRPDHIPVSLKNKSIPEINEIVTTSYNSCEGLKASIEIQMSSDGLMEYTIGGSWSTSNIFTNVEPGTYQIQVSPVGSSCVNNFSDPVEVVDIGVLEVKASNIQEVSCEDADDAIVGIEIAQGVPPYEISWQGESVSETMVTDISEFKIPDLSAGKYTYLVLDGNGCSYEAEFQVDNLDLSYSITEFQDTLICDGDTITYRGSDSIFNYVLFLDDQFIAEGREFKLTADGHYQVIADRGDGCYTDVDFIVEHPNADDLGMDFLMSSKGLMNEGIIVVNVSEPMPEDYHWIYDTATTSMDTIEGLSTTFMFKDTGTHQISLASEVDGCTHFIHKEIEIYGDTTEVDWGESPLAGGSRLVDWSVTPNPNIGNFLVDIALENEGIVRLQIYDVYGTLVRGTFMYGERTYSKRFFMPDLTPGVYSVVLIHKGDVFQKSILIIQ